MDLLQAIRKSRLIAIMRGIPFSQALPAARALFQGGVRLLEVTFDQKAGGGAAPQIISAIMEKLPELTVGAGTVMTVSQVRQAKEAGASFILAPNTNRRVMEEAKALSMGAVPGAMTPSEIADAYECGADAVKLFPAGELGAGYLKAIRAPLNHIPLIAVGGVDLSNLSSFLKAGAIGAGIGSSLVDPVLIRECRFEELTSLASQYTGILCETERSGML